jgi:signal transduction histidine kinase
LKLFTKIFLCTSAVVTISLSTMGYLIISNSFQNALEREKQRGLEEYQLIKFTLQASLLTAAENCTISVNNMESIAQQTAGIAPSGTQSAILTEDQHIVFSNFPAEYSFSNLSEVDDDTLSHMIQARGNTYWHVVMGKFSQSNNALYLVTGRNITSVIQEKHSMERGFYTAFCIVLLISAMILATLSAFLSTPIKKLTQKTKAFAAGEHYVRAMVKGSEEIVELSQSFNEMAEQIEVTIQQLKLSAQQKEDFVSNFSHELKTPLTSVIGYADMIYHNSNLTRAEIKNAAGYIVNEGMRLEALSKKMMELIILNRHNFTLIEMYMDEVLQDAADTLMPVLEQNGVEISVAAQHFCVRIEFDLFKTLLLNLIDNAVKAGSKHISLLGQISSSNYIVTIADDGSGIPKEKLDRITEAFYVVDTSRSRKQHGAGLGLAIASRIASVHGTQLEYTSQVGKGTSVRISLVAEEMQNEEE